MIADAEIRSADPSAVIEQYTPYIQKLANRYIPALNQTGAVDMDDLLQVGRIAAVQAQKEYDPDRGAFLNCLFYHVRSAMRGALGFNRQTGAPAPALVYLDEPASDDGSISLGDTIQDPEAVPIDETFIENETKRETVEQVRAAVDRIKSEKQREVIRRVYLLEQSRQAAADDMGMNIKALYALDEAGRKTLHRDSALKLYAMPFYHVSVGRYNSTWTSAVEMAVIWRDEHLPKHQRQ